MEKRNSLTRNGELHHPQNSCKPKDRFHAIQRRKVTEIFKLTIFLAYELTVLYQKKKEAQAPFLL